MRLFCTHRSAAEGLAALYPRHVEVGDRGGAAVVVGWSQAPSAVRAMSVVMRDVLTKDRTQVLLADDKHPIGALGSDGAYPPFGIGVRARAPRRDLHHRPGPGPRPAGPGRSPLGVLFTALFARNDTANRDGLPGCRACRTYRRGFGAVAARLLPEPRSAQDRHASSEWRKPR